MSVREEAVITRLGTRKASQTGSVGMERRARSGSRSAVVTAMPLCIGPRSRFFEGEVIRARGPVQKARPSARHKKRMNGTPARTVVR
jgi:hypothetical protein